MTLPRIATTRPPRIGRSAASSSTRDLSDGTQRSSVTPRNLNVIAQISPDAKTQPKPARCSFGRVPNEQRRRLIRVLVPHFDDEERASGGSVLGVGSRLGPL